MLNSNSIPEFVPLSKFNDFMQFPSVDCIRQLRFYNTDGFNDLVIRKVGKRLYIKVPALLDWIENSNNKGANYAK